MLREINEPTHPAKTYTRENITFLWKISSSSGDGDDDNGSKKKKGKQ